MNSEFVIILVMGGGFLWVVGELDKLAKTLKEIAGSLKEIKNSTAMTVAHLDALRSELKRKGVT